ncbi:MAG: hypothetical protein KatS3mg099_387 [Candidatus Parcubacteria bacterium]|nr:MAG: hypothetical protein KatS3mg099_387 [Candidatus Parcubacteria bacterium]
MWHTLANPPWEQFFADKARQVVARAREGFVVDIGAGLRVYPNRGNRYNAKRARLFDADLLASVKILDPVPTYNPDVVGDIHKLPFADESVDGILCLAVLEHVERPWVAVREMHRVLKKGGLIFVYVPFLFYYHAEAGYYKDYWRFSRDALEELFKDFEDREMCSVAGAVETLCLIAVPPFGRAISPTRFGW